MLASSPGPLMPTALRKEGDDRLVVEWNDGHDAGIYTLENLRALSQLE